MFHGTIVVARNRNCKVYSVVLLRQIQCLKVYLSKDKFILTKFVYENRIE